MNIKELIEAGAYPKDDKGRALVPTHGGETFVVCATDKPGTFPLLGWYLPSGDKNAYAADFAAQPYDRALLPPPPRKVKVTAWAIVDLAGNLCSLRANPPSGVAAGLQKCVTLTGEYDEPWPDASRATTEA